MCTRIAGNGGALLLSGAQTAEAIKNIHANYVETGKVFTLKNAENFISLGFSVAGMGLAGASLAKSRKALKNMYEGKAVAETVAVSNATKKVGNESVKYSSFRDQMSPEEVVRYDNYWKQGTGSYTIIDGNEVIVGKGNKVNTRQRLQVSPGTRSMMDVKYGKKGEMYYRETVFDEYGRKIGTNDYTDHGMPNAHTNPHYHTNSPLDPSEHGKPKPGLHPETP